MTLTLSLLYQEAEFVTFTNSEPSSSFANIMSKTAFTFVGLFLSVPKKTFQSETINLPIFRSMTFQSPFGLSLFWLYYALYNQK